MPARTSRRSSADTPNRAMACARAWSRSVLGAPRAEASRRSRIASIPARRAATSPGPSLSFVVDDGVMDDGVMDDGGTVGRALAERTGRMACAFFFVMDDGMMDDGGTVGRASAERTGRMACPFSFVMDDGGTLSSITQSASQQNAYRA